MAESENTGKVETDLDLWRKAVSDYELHCTTYFRKIRQIGGCLMLALFVVLAMVDASWWMLALLGFFMVVVLAGLSFKMPENPKHEKEFKLKLESADLGNRIFQGNFFNGEIREATRRDLRWLVPSVESNDRLGLLKRIGISVNWYLVPKARHFRESWSMALAFSGMPIIMLVMAFVDLYSPYSSPEEKVNSFVMPLIFLLGFSGFVLVKQQMDTAWFISYLNKLLCSETGAQAILDPEPAEVAKHEVGQDSRMLIQLDLVINLCHQQLEQSTRMKYILLYMVMFLVLFLGGAFVYRLLGQVGFTLLIVAMAMAIAFSVYAIKKRMPALKNKCLKQLEESSIAIRLASGELTREYLLGFIPFAIRWVVSSARFSKPLEGEAQEVSNNFVLVALNLDWFLNPPKQLIRPIWIATSLPVLWIIPIFSSPFASTSSSGQLPLWVTAIILTVSFWGWFAFFADTLRTQASSLALIEYLREFRK